VPASGVTPDGRLKSGRLAGLTMWGAIFTLSWPILIESLLSSMVGLTDTYMAAQLSAAATDAIGGASYIMWFMGLIAMALGIGATALVSRAVGAGRMAVAHAATGQTLLLGLVGGAAMGVLVFALAPVIARLLSMPPDAHAAFVTYLRIVAVGSPALTMASAAIACARGSGDSLRPLISMVVLNIVNFILSFVLSGVDLRVSAVVDGAVTSRVILSNPFGLNWGIAGVAWGTVIAEYVGLAVVLAILGLGYSGVRLKRSRLKPHKPTLGRLVRLGIPSFFETLGMWAGNFLVIVVVGWLALGGAAGVTRDGGGLLGAHIIAIRIESFSYLPGFAMGTAAATLVGQYLGAGAPRLAKKAVKRCMTITAWSMGFLGAALCLFPRTITGLVTSQPEHLEVVPRLLFITGLVQVPFGIGIILRSALRGAGDVKPVMYITWACTYLVRLPLVYLLSGVRIPLPGGGSLAHPIFERSSLAMLWAALCIEIVVRGAAFLWRFRHGGWMNAKV
jgi:putative MATE family efflux protein